VTGQDLTDLTHVNNDITQALTLAQQSVSGIAGAADQLRTVHEDILSTIANNLDLTAAALSNDGNNTPGFQGVPPVLPAGVTAANAPHATFADLGAIYDDAANQLLAGVTPANHDQVVNDLTAVENGLKTLVATDPHQFANGLTGIHVQTIENQINLQISTYDNLYGTNPDAGRSTNDNILDIIDIVQGDTNLANAASQNGVTGWHVFPDYGANPIGGTLAAAPPHFQDNADQTNFWADFIASSNTLGQQAQQLVANGTAAEIANFTEVLQGFEQNVANFDAAQGGVFEARFDNELLANSGTVGADTNALITGLLTHNAALVTAGAEGYAADAADVSGNNVPVNGGTYNSAGFTVADALSTATGPLPAPSLTPLTPGGTEVTAAAGTVPNVVLPDTAVGAGPATPSSANPTASVTAGESITTPGDTAIVTADGYQPNYLPGIGNPGTAGGTGAGGTGGTGAGGTGAGGTTGAGAGGGGGQGHHHHHDHFDFGALLAAAPSAAAPAATAAVDPVAATDAGAVPATVVADVSHVVDVGHHFFAHDHFHHFM
jgi:trimeric autotransporter adhesin